MHFQRQVSQALDAEHRSSLNLLDQLERALVRGQDEELTALARPLIRQIDSEVARHFGFEEDELFPRLREAGDGDMAALLEQEHADIRELCAELRPLLDALSAGTLTAAQRAPLRRLALELVERMASHIQKETMGLLPALEDLLDEPTDQALSLAYAAA
jgi:hemerythrin-like domain-containing protein